MLNKQTTLAPPEGVGEQPFTLADIRRLLTEKTPVVLAPTAANRIAHCRSYLDKRLAHEGELHYGINTGFGFLQHVPINSAQLETLQHNLLLSHACGMGDPVPMDVVRLMLLFKVQSLAAGHSGVQLATVQRLLDLYNADLFPVVLTQGSLGASGDLAPLSHLSLPLIGEGHLWEGDRQRPASEVLRERGWAPHVLRSKEGIALINGTQFMSAYGVRHLLRVERLLQWADWIGALSADAFFCRQEPFHPLLHAIRPHPGQIASATRIRRLLAGSELAATAKRQVQDPYSFRCMPQVHGASADVWQHVAQVFLREINAVTDNPNIFPEEDQILSGGNFHGQPLAMALDYLCIAVAELGSISERRTYQLISGQRELPLFLVDNPGLNSGLMIPQYTAAGIVSANKQLCTPASIDSLVSSNGQEDHVSMGANAAVKCEQVINHLERILGIELLTAAQALNFRRPRHTSPPLEALWHAFREQVTYNHHDRLLASDMTAAVHFIQHHELDQYESLCQA